MKKFNFLISNSLLVSTFFLSQISVISCSTIKTINGEKNEIENKPTIPNNDENNQKPINKSPVIKRENIQNVIDKHSKLTLEAKAKYKEEQKQYYSSFSIDSINKFLQENANTNIDNFFANLNKQNNLDPSNPLYIDPELGSLLVEDILNGNILIKDIDNSINEFKNNNETQYNSILNNLNLDNQEVESSKDITNITETTKEEINTNNEYHSIIQEEINNPEVEEELDELFKLNDKYQQGQKININFKSKNGLFEYSDYNQLETRYIEGYNLYFNNPLTIIIEMNDGKKIYLNDFDISNLEVKYYREGTLYFYGVTELIYNNKSIYKFKEGGWRDGYRYVSKMYYHFDKLSNKINENNNKLINKQDNKTYVLSIDKKTYDFIYSLESKINSLQSYYHRSRILNCASWTLSVIASAVAVAWIASSILSFGATAGAAVTASLQASTLLLTTALTEVELQKTKKDIEKYINLYNSKEYDILIGLLNKYSNNKIIESWNNNQIQITIKAYYDYYQIWNYFGKIVKITDLKIIKSINNLLNKPKEIIYSFDKIKNSFNFFQNLKTSSMIKLSNKIGRRFVTRIQNVLVKTIAQKLICAATAWANPIGLIIDSFDILIMVIGICNDIFSNIDINGGRYE